MSKVTVALGLSVQLNENSMEFAKPYVEIRDIDTEDNIEQQIAKAISVSLQVWDAETELIYSKLLELTDTERSGLIGDIKHAIKNAMKAV